MKSAVRIFLLLISGYLFPGCSNHADVAGSFGITPDSALNIRYAQFFKAERHGNAYRIFLPDPEKPDRILRKLLLAEQKPASVAADVDFIQIPIKNAACLSSVFTGYLDALELSDKIALVDEADYICSKKVQTLIGEGRIKEAGSGTALNYETLLNVKPDAVFMDQLPGAESPVYTRLRQLGQPVVMCQNFLETTPLGRAEWIKFFSLFFGRWTEAEQLFGEVEEHYSVYSYTAGQQEQKPTVFLGALYGDVWNVSGGGSFAAQYLQDAGAQYMWSDDTTSGNYAMSLESVWQKARDAEYWLNVNDYRSLSEISGANPRYSLFGAFRSGKVYNNNRWVNAKRGNAYWEYGAVRPDLVLADLIKIFHPDLMEDHTFVFYTPLK